MKKLFREHRGGLVESLATTIECPKGLADIEEYIRTLEHWRDYVRKIEILPEKLIDNRLPADWGGISYYVLASFNDGNSGVIGMCNFYE